MKILTPVARRILVAIVLVSYILFGVWTFVWAHPSATTLFRFFGVTIVLWALLIIAKQKKT